MSRGTVTINGSVHANGGAGESQTGWPHGAGGSGGGILLEAPSISITGSVEVNGGSGGSTSTAGASGIAATGTDPEGDPGGNAVGYGGGGGGGGGGRVRLNSVSPIPCDAVSPNAEETCSTDTL